MTTRPLAPTDRPFSTGGGSTASRLGRLAVEFLPPFVVALVALPFIIQYGRVVPWLPSTIDLQVYVYAVHDMLAGRDIFACLLYTSPSPRD